MIELHLLVTTVAMIVVARAMIVNGNSLLVMVMMVVVMMVVMIMIVIMVVVLAVIAVEHCPPPILMGVVAQRWTDWPRIGWVDDRALLLGREAGLQASDWQRSYRSLGVDGRCRVRRARSGEG